MIDLRIILWFIFGAAFFTWAIILIGGNKDYWKQFLISLAIWFTILIIQVSTKNVNMPSYTFMSGINAPSMLTTLYNWLPNLFIVLLPIGIYRIWKNTKERKRLQKENSNEK